MNIVINMFDGQDWIKIIFFVLFYIRLESFAHKGPVAINLRDNQTPSASGYRSLDRSESKACIDRISLKGTVLMASGPTTPVSGISQMSSTPASASLGGGSSEDSSKLKTFLMVLKK